MAFEQAANFSFDPKVKEQALYNYALCIHETSYSPFAESVTVFERFLNEFPNSPYTERVNDYLIEVYMNTRSYEAALKSIAKIEHPGTRIMEEAEDFVPAGHTGICECPFPGGSGALQPIACCGAIQSGDKGGRLFLEGGIQLSSGPFSAGG